MIRWLKSKLPTKNDDTPIKSSPSAEESSIFSDPKWMTSESPDEKENDEEYLLRVIDKVY